MRQQFEVWPIESDVHGDGPRGMLVRIATFNVPAVARWLSWPMAVVCGNDERLTLLVDARE